MILACDVHYHGNDAATAAGISFADWPDAHPASEYKVRVAPVARYEPGAFYKRELPCLLALLNELPRLPETIIIDGFVTLRTEQRPGLGAHLYAALNERTPIVGVAKSPFRGTPPDCALLRGKSRTPLFVSTAGMPLDEAKDHIAAMHGAYRMPTLLSAVDRLCRL